MEQPHKDRILSHFPNVAFHGVAIAASAGGLKAIGELLAALPANFPAAILIVQHLHPTSPSHFADLLNKQTILPVKQAADGDVLRPGRVYTAIPDRHLLVNSDGTLSLSDAEKMSFARPAADLLFRSLALTYQSRAIAVVLTGKMSDGALGVRAIKKSGGTVIVQEPATCEYSSMPSAAEATGKADFVLPSPSAIAAVLVKLVMLEGRDQINDPSSKRIA